MISVVEDSIQQLGASVHASRVFRYGPEVNSIWSVSLPWESIWRDERAGTYHGMDIRVATPNDGLEFGNGFRGGVNPGTCGDRPMGDEC